MPCYDSSQAAEEPVQFVGSLEVGFEFAGGEALAEVIETAGEEIEGCREDILIGKNDVAPRGIRAAGKAEGIAEAGAGESDGEAVFVEAVIEEASEGDGGELRQMRGKADGVVVLRSA